MNAYSAGENDFIDAVAWVEEPTLGKAIAIAGGTTSFSDDEDDQAWVALIDPGGEYIWSNLYGTVGLTYSTSIAQVLGSDGLLASLAVGGSREGNAWMMEVDAADGTPGWQCEYEQFNLIRSVVVMEDGQFVFTATTSAPEPCFAVVKTNRSPANPCGLAWETVFGEDDPSDDVAFSLKLTSDSEFIIAGWTSLYGARQGIVMKLDSDGGPVWQSTIASSGSHSTAFYDVIEVLDEDGLPNGFVAVGYLGFDGTGANDTVMVLTRLSPGDGAERWTRFYGYDALGEWLSALAVHQKPDGAIVVAGVGANDVLDDPYHRRILVFQVREDTDGDGDAIVDLEWKRQLNPEAVGDIDFAVTSITGSPGGGSIVGAYYPSVIGEAHDPLLMRLNEEGNIPPNCLIDPVPPLEQVTHLYDVATVPDEPTLFIDPEAGSETFEVPDAEEIPIRNDCRPCVKRVNGNLPPEMAGDGDTWETALITIQEGIDEAAAEISDPSGTLGYCEVWVAQDDYYVYVADPSNTIRMRPGVHVYGGFSGGDPPDDYGWEGSREDRDWEQNITRIIGTSADDDSLRTFHVVTAPATNPSTLDGFHVVGGRANGGPGLDRWGGGMVNVFSSPKVANCTFYDNLAWWGGAMANVFAAPDVINCTFKTADNEMVFVQPNAAFAGGAIINWGWAPWSGDGPTIDGCTFADNYARNFYGGGVHNQNSPAEIVRSTFSGNHAYAGGGVSIGQTVDGMGAPSIEECTFNDNVASRWWDTNNGGTGGALVAFFGQYVTPATATIVENSLFHENATGQQDGGAIVAITVSSTPKVGLVNCTIADNWTGGVSWHSEPTFGAPPVVYNSILWGNGPHEISPDCDSGAMVYYSDVMGGAGCEGFAGNISSNPLFNGVVDPVYRLQSGSACIDAANPGTAPLTDIEGEYRDPNPDMGAYEYFDGGTGE